MTQAIEKKQKTKNSKITLICDFFHKCHKKCEISLINDAKFKTLVKK